MSVESIAYAAPETTNEREGAAFARLERYEVWIVAALLVYFAARLVFFALNVQSGVPPDELEHVARIAHFETVWGIPEDTIAMARASYVPDNPYLYYWVAARLSALNVFGLSELVYQRLANTFFALGAVYCGWLWSRLVIANVLARILFVVMITNILMFTFIGATVSYDPLTNFCCAAAMLFLTRYLKDGSGTALLWSGIFLALGALVKVTILPLILIAGVCVLARERRTLGAIPAKVAAYFRNAGFGRWVLVAALGAVGGLAALLYVPNLLAYRQPVPRADQVYDRETMMLSPLWAREIITHRFRTGAWTLEEALQHAQSIEVESIRGDTMDLLITGSYKRQSGIEFEALSQFEYVFPWTLMMAERTFGVLAHELALKQGLALLPYFAIFLFAAATFFERWRPWRRWGLVEYMALVTVFYTVFLMQYVNYRAYLNSQEFVIALQGRYLFPVLLPLYGLVAQYYLDERRARWQGALFCAACVAFLYGDLPSFLLDGAREKFLVDGG